MKRFEIAVVGASLGGLSALLTLLRLVGKDFPVPMVIAQHRTPKKSSVLCDLLNEATELLVREVEDRTRLQPGHVFLCPPDYHVIVDRDELALSTEGRVNYARPSIDVLFESAAHVYRQRALGAILTGSSEDGARGAARLSQRGGTLLVQDPTDAESPIAPRAAMRLTTPTLVAPLPELARWMLEHTAASNDDTTKANRPR